MSFAADRRHALRSLGLGATGPWWLGSAWGQERPSSRVALVIGNAAYPGTGALLNPGRDAEGVAGMLSQLGFTVVHVKDGSRSQMTEAIHRAGALLNGQRGVGVLYYAGHGLQMGARNFMLPVDAQIESEADVARECVDVSAVVDAFRKAGNRINIVVLDACRDNPFATVSSGKGLAPVDAPPNTFLAYATAPGHVAEDGSAADGNGLYTGFLLKELKRPSARIEDVFKRVRLGVRQASAGRQVPWESTSLEEDFWFDGKAHSANSIANEGLLKAEEATWERIRDSAQPQDLYAFLLVFPNGRYAEQANFLLNQKAAPQVLATIAPTQPSGASRPVGLETASAPLEIAYVGAHLVPGDRYEWVWRDGYTGVVRRSGMTEVADVNGLEVRFQGDPPEAGRDAMGARRGDYGASYDRAIIDLPAEYAIGKRWSGAYKYRSGEWSGSSTYSARVTGREVLAIGTRRYNAWDIDSIDKFVNLGGMGGQSLSSRIWAIPEFGVPLRQTISSGDRSGMGNTKKLLELVSLNISR